jgi:hypothetical protein
MREGIKERSPRCRGFSLSLFKRAPTLAETASRVREQEVFGCAFAGKTISGIPDIV